MVTSKQKKELKEFLIRVLMILLSSLIISVNFKSFVSAGDLFPGDLRGLPV